MGDLGSAINSKINAGKLRGCVAMRRNRCTKFFWCGMVALWVLALYLAVCIFIPKITHNIPYQHAESLPIAYGNVGQIDRGKFKKDIERIAGPQQYFFVEQDLSGQQLFGRTIIAARTIIMHNNMSDVDFVFYFTHEYVHLKHFTANDRYANFQAFKLLYESGNDTYRQVALNYAYKDMNGGIPHDYSCWGYIYKYLKGRTK